MVKTKTRTPVVKVKSKVDSYLSRRPHRSFRVTRRRDYKRSLKLPGYISFTKHVLSTLWENRKVFILLATLSAVVTALVVGIASQDTYNLMKKTVDATSGGLFSGTIGEIGKAGLLFLTSATGGISPNLSDAQMIYAGLITILTWLICVWLLRNLLAGHKVKLRDAVYNAGAPIVASLILFIVVIIELLPVALALIGYSAASATGLLNNGVEAMLFWIVAGLLALISVYLLTSTFFALVIVTLPGMYPFQAIKVAGDLVIGRRLRILYRMLWMIGLIVLFWALVTIPIILVDSWVKGLWPAINWLPVVPIVLLILGSLTIIFSSSYIYLLYRKVVADEAGPA